LISVWATAAQSGGDKKPTMLMHLFVQAVGVDGFHLTGTVIGNLNRASFSKAPTTLCLNRSFKRNGSLLTRAL
jgi:hypothetical protein